MTSFPVTEWDKRNVWVLPSGELCVRPSLPVISPGSYFAEGVLGSRTFRNPRTNETLHYLAYRSGVNTIITIMDEYFTSLFLYTIESTTPSGVVSIVSLNDEVGVFSPDWTARWGIIGGPLIQAESVTSINDLNTKTLDAVPRGIAVEWAGRIAVCEKNRLYFSDALAIRTFVAANTSDPPGGFIFGLHVSSDGYLYTITSTGVYTLPETASVSGQLVLGVWQKVTDYSSTGYNQTCVSNGRLFGLTQRGYKAIDEASAEEVFLNDKVMSRSTQYGRMNFQDYREGIIIGSDFGLIVSIDRFMHWTDVATGVKSWVTASKEGIYGDLYTYGIFHDSDGSMIFVSKSGYRLFRGNKHEEEDASGLLGGWCYASLAGRIVTSPAASPRIRSVTFASDSAFTLTAYVNGKVRTALYPPKSPVVGTDSWGVSAVWSEPPLRSRTFNFHEKGDEVTCECVVESYPSKIPDSVDIEFGGLGLRRPNR